MVDVTGYYQQLHFQMDELELYYNFPVVQNEDDEQQFELCPHMKKLMCSRAHELAPDKCITERKCELYFNRDELFTQHGVHAPTLLKIDKELRSQNSD